jgi:hypothetical protein
VTNTILDAGTDQRVASALTMPTRGFRPFTTTTKRDALLGSPLEGDTAAVTGEDRLYTYDGSAWQRTGIYSSTGRTGCAVSRSSTQAISNGVLSTIVWDTEAFDSDNFQSGGTIQIPSGLGGVYQLMLRVLWASDPGTAVGIVITTGGFDYVVGPARFLASQLNYAVTFTLPMVPTSTVLAKVYQASGLSINVTAFLDMYRQMP